jgi:hypothetical protein
MSPLPSSLPTHSLQQAAEFEEQIRLALSNAHLAVEGPISTVSRGANPGLRVRLNSVVLANVYA